MNMMKLYYIDICLLVNIRPCNCDSIGITSWDCGLLIMAIVVDDSLEMVTA